MVELEKKIQDNVCEILTIRKKLLDAQEQRIIVTNIYNDIDNSYKKSLDNLRELIPAEKAEFVVICANELIKVKKDEKEYHFKIAVESIPSLRNYFDENSKI